MYYKSINNSNKNNHIILDKRHKNLYNLIRVTKKAYNNNGEIAQLARATGSYPVGREFESPSRYQKL